MLWFEFKIPPACIESSGCKLIDLGGAMSYYRPTFNQCKNLLMDSNMKSLRWKVGNGT